MEIRHLGQNQHWVVTGLLLAALIPAYYLLGLPLQIDWSTFLGIYWIGQTVHSIFAAVLLYIVAFPLKETLIPVWHRYRNEKLRFVLACCFIVPMIWGFGWSIGIMIVLDGLAIIELIDRTRSQPGGFSEAVRRVFFAALYLFVGLILVFAYIHLIASVEFVGAEDPFFNRLDALVFGGATVGSISHAAAGLFPPRIYLFLQTGYTSLFTLIGGALIIIGICFSQDRLFRYVGTLLTAFYLAVGFFYLFPSIGPFFLWRTPQVQSVPLIHASQQAILARTNALWNHSEMIGINVIRPTDYFIAFPCMHLALAAIAFWYLREKRRFLILAVPYMLVLFSAVVLFEWHYLVGIAAGLAVAAFAIMVVETPRKTKVCVPQAQTSYEHDEEEVVLAVESR